MIRLFLPCFALLWIPLHAQTRTVACKLVCFEKVPGSPEVLYTKSEQEGEFLTCPLSLSINTAPVDLMVDETGKLAFINGQAEDSAVVASVAIPKDVRQAYLFMIPAAPGGEKLFDIIMLPESEKTTPEGGAYFCNIASSKVRLSLGEYKYELLPGKFVSVTQPTKRDKYNMVQMNLMMEMEKGWVSVRDNMTRFSSRDRYFIFTYLHPRFNRPMAKVYQQAIAISTADKEG